MKERGFNPAQAQRKEKKKLKVKVIHLLIVQKKEASKTNKQNDALTQENRRLEMEFSDLIKKEGSTASISSVSLQAKLGEINNVRMQLDMDTKTMADYETLIRKAKKEAKKPKAIEKQTVEDNSSPEEEALILQLDGIYEDLSTIEIPSGVAPETEGQF
jgi:hypothetical protein